MMNPFHNIGPRGIADACRNGTGSFVDSDVLSEQAKVTGKDMDYYTNRNADGNILTLYNIGKVSFVFEMIENHTTNS